jgi:hypothetical protein
MQKKRRGMLWHGNFMLQNQTYDAAGNKRTITTGRKFNLNSISWAQADEFQCHQQKKVLTVLENIKMSFPLSETI